MKKLLIICIAALVFTGCKKSMVCYKATDHYGNDIGEICGTSEDDCFNKVRGQVWNGAAITTKAEFEATFHKE